MSEILGFEWKVFAVVIFSAVSIILGLQATMALSAFTCLVYRVCAHGEINILWVGVKNGRRVDPL